MIVSIWRNSHLALAISSFLVLLAACITGIVLAFEPIVQKSHNYRIDAIDTLSVSEALSTIQGKYPSVQSINVDDYEFVSIHYEDQNDKQVHQFISPASGEDLGPVRPQSAFFQWMTAAHRSLFLHETGRIIMAVTSFLLLLIALSGIILIVKRQNGWRRYFSKIEKTGSAKYYHALFGRISMFFIIAIALTGTYIAVYRYAPPVDKAIMHIDENKLIEGPRIPANTFPIFKNIKLSAVKSIQFPFSDFPEDYFYLQLKDREICVNQFTGALLSEQVYPKSYQLETLSMQLHTGRTSIIWALVLAVASGYIIFFIFSGFAITLQRRKSRLKNKYSGKKAKIIILVGSENGSTIRFANSVYKQLINQNQKVYITNLSDYTRFAKAEDIIIMSSTYGQGVAPSNAKKFQDKVRQIQQPAGTRVSILGFGSRAYPAYCKFALDIDSWVQNEKWSILALPLHTINDASIQDFSDWLTKWSAISGFHLRILEDLISGQRQMLRQFEVIHKSPLNEDNTFSITIKPLHDKRFTSGDLLAIYPKQDHRERLYSIARIDGLILLSVKIHEGGIGSGYLYALNSQQRFPARIIKNTHFHFPKKARQIIMIANGTGIAPFLGLISENHKQRAIELYCGFRTKEAFAPYKTYLEQYLRTAVLTDYHLALSRADPGQYVSHLLLNKKKAVAASIRQQAVFMICGSLNMQKDVLAIIDNICLENNLPDTQKLIDNGHILLDCY